MPGRSRLTAPKVATPATAATAVVPERVPLAGFVPIARVTVPAKLAAKGAAGAKKDEAVSVTWQGGDRWLVRHEPSGKRFAWHWQMTLVERKKK